MKDYKRTPQDAEEDRLEREWKQKQNLEALLLFLRRNPTGKIVSETKELAEG